MSLTSIALGHLLIPQALSINNASSLIDAASEVAGMILPVWKAGNIRAVHWHTNTVTTGGSNACDIRIETVDATNGDPTGTLWGTNTNGAQAIVNTDDNVWFRTVLTADATVALGDVIAVIIANPATNFSSMNVSVGIQDLNTTSRYPYAVNPTRSSPGSTCLAIMLEYDDGTFMPCVGYCPLFRGSVVITTASNPDEVGLYFTPDVPCTVIGFGAVLALAAGADFRAALYQSGNDTPLATFTHDGDITSTTSSGVYTAPFSTAVDLAAGTTYRIGIVALTANNVTVSYGIASTAASLASLTASDARYSARNRSGTTDPDAAAWSETNTQLPCIWPVMSRFDDGAGGGGSGLVQLINPNTLVA